MYQSSQYQHPVLEPFSRGAWGEIAYSWAIAAAIMSAVLLLIS
jgi:hypothetical protein